MKILLVLTSHDRLGNTDQKTGFWLEEFAAPYYVFKDAGATITLASPAGGHPPIDPKSDEPGAQTTATERFRQDPETQRHLATTVRLASVSAADFDAIFYPGGHGPLWDLVNDPDSISLIEAAERTDKPLALVCHAPGALTSARRENGEPLVAGRKVTGFSNSEEGAIGLTNIVPFLVEDVLQRLGAHYEKGADWLPHIVADGNLITGQNPASSEVAAKALLELLKTRR